MIAQLLPPARAKPQFYMKLLNCLMRFLFKFYFPPDNSRSIMAIVRYRSEYGLLQNEPRIR